MYYLDICSFVHYTSSHFCLLRRKWWIVIWWSLPSQKVLPKIKEIIREVMSTLRFQIEEHNFEILRRIIIVNLNKTAARAHEATVEVSAASPASPPATGSPTITARKLATHLPLAAAHRLLLANRFVLSLLFVFRFVLPPRRHFGSRLVITLYGQRCANCWTLNARCYLPILSIEHRWLGRFYLFSSGTRSERCCNYAHYFFPGNKKTASGWARGEHPTLLSD